MYKKTDNGKYSEFDLAKRIIKLKNYHAIL